MHKLFLLDKKRFELHFNLYFMSSEGTDVSTTTGYETLKIPFVLAVNIGTLCSLTILYCY